MLESDEIERLGVVVAFDFSSIDSGATAWVLAATGMVLLMTPGLSLFYGGMVRAKNVLGILLQNFMVMALVSVVWILVGFSLAFGSGNPLIGDLHFAGLQNLTDQIPGYVDRDAQIIPPVVFVAFQMTFAILAPALITGATADRWRLGAFVPFMVGWSILVYAPVAHWVFSPVGWANGLGALDFAGGTVVHVNAGAAALAMTVVLGRRRGWPREPMRPHNLTLVMLGTGLLWFGWLGFNAGSGLRADSVAGYAFVNSIAAGAAGLLAWTAVEKVRFGKATSLGAASGVVTGLVGITPAAGYVEPVAAVVIGALAGSFCALAVGLKLLLGLDDSLDVVAVHLGGGVVGSLCVGLFATTGVNPGGADGLFYGGEYRLLGLQALAVLVVLGFSFVVTLALGKALDLVVGNRVTVRGEVAGLDLALHGETAYQLGTPAPSTVGGNPHSSPSAPVRVAHHSPEGAGSRSRSRGGDRR